MEPGSDTLLTKAAPNVDAWCRVADVTGLGVVVERKGSRPGRTASQSRNWFGESAKRLLG